MADLFPDDLATAKHRAKKAHARLREREADFTPRPVAREVLRWYFDHVLRIQAIDWRGFYLTIARGSVVSGPFKALRILDVGAGAGVWASEVRRLIDVLGFPVHITAVELDADEAPHLRRHADEVIIDEWRVFAEQCEREGRRFDLVIGNPPFSQARAQPNPDHKTRGVSEYLVETSMPATLMRIAGAVLLYLTQQTWTKTASGYEVRRAYPPAFAVDVPGSVSHRTGINPENGKRYGGDSIPYSASLWLGAPAGPHVGLTATGMLEPFDGRSWKEGLRPGAEPDEWLAANGIPTVDGVVTHLAGMLSAASDCGSQR